MTTKRLLITLAKVLLNLPQYSFQYVNWMKTFAVTVICVSPWYVYRRTHIPFPYGCRVFCIPLYPPWIPKSLAICVSLLYRNFAGSLRFYLDCRCRSPYVFLSGLCYKLRHIWTPVLACVYGLHHKGVTPCPFIAKCLMPGSCSVQPCFLLCNANMLKLIYKW